MLNVNHTLDPVSGGGTAERTFQMSRSLAKAGVGCDVLSLDLGVTPELAEALGGARLTALPVLSRRYYVPKFSPARIRDLVRDADVIHLMGHWTFVNALVYLFARRLGKPYVVCSAGALRIQGRSRRFKQFYNRVVGERILRNASGHIAVTADERPDFESYGIPGDRVTVIPNGINPEDYRPGNETRFRRRHGLGDAPFVLFIGRLNPVKGPDLLVRAFCEAGKELGRYHLVLAGPDEGMLPALREIAAGRGAAERVHFVGYLGGAEKARAYHAADLLVVPSRNEAMSIVALEAGAAGTPVLLTDRCGFGQVEAAAGGRVVPATEEGIRRGLMDLLLAGPEDLKVMGENLRKLVEKRFTWDSVIGDYLKLYGRILSGKGSTAGDRRVDGPGAS